MALDTDDVATLETLFTEASSSQTLLAGVRRRFPALTATRCDASDIGVEPAFRSFPRFDLHLVDGRNHCWQLTGNPDDATGIVVVVNRGGP
ncbi:hypothetical protein [Telmatospirillum sp.]|uniref:hypothetical protein n=1 Tax=Telmatospirillum sp. TaxID=2079197 RepID=UPI002846F8C6|nr:hypothetical protein [Telmatospirillum sp.]MDR3437691.1 hypothetical protein [Telmatospirillum sp.]